LQLGLEAWRKDGFLETQDRFHLGFEPPEDPRGP
jgi:hypothetical protein